MRNSYFKILIVALIIATIGVISIYSSTYQKQGKPWEDIYKRQILWIIIGLICFAFISNLHYRRLCDWTYILYAVVIIFLLLVLGLGLVRMGAQRWLRIGGFNFQPSEFAKIIIIIFLARYFSRKSASDISILTGKFGILRGIIFPFMFVALPAAMIIEQPDLGSGMIILLVFMTLMYLTGVKLRYIIMFFFIFILPVPFLWNFLHDYQKQRLLVFINPNIDPLGAGYTVIQSKIAIGSGWFFGKGWLSGTQSQLHFLPESHTDFIFATFAEEWGFLGCVVLLLLYFIIIRWGFVIAQRTNDFFGKLLASGIALMFSIQVFVNIAMNMGLAPVVGLPLPLLSYGGSSVLVTFIALGILVNIDRTRAVF